jgi:hypothetical protein
MSNFDSWNSSYARKDVFFLVRVKFGTLAALRRRPQVQMTMGWFNTKNNPGAETFRRSSHMFHSDSKNSGKRIFLGEGPD